MKGLVRFLLVVFLIHYFLFDSIISYSGVTVIKISVKKETEIIPEIIQHSMILIYIKKDYLQNIINDF